MAWMAEPKTNNSPGKDPHATIITVQEEHNRQTQLSTN